MRIPKDLWFDGLTINTDEIQGDLEEENVNVELLVQNGMITEDHEKVAYELEVEITKAMNQSLKGEDYETTVFADHTYTAADFEPDPETGDMITKMQPVNKRRQETDEKEIFILIEDLEIDDDEE